MPFRFKKSESPSKGVRRACREHVGVALGWLRKSRRPAAVHKVRKEIKKVRAILRLVRGGTGRGAHRKAAKALRKAADRLAASRDARVMLQAFEKLAGDCAKRFPQTHLALRQHCQHEARRFQKADSLAVVERLLRKTSRRVGRLKTKATGWLAIEPGLNRGYDRGREMFKLVRRQPSSENFHAWRKQVKNFWFHLQLICPAWPPETCGLVDKLELLGEQLGEEHDLFLLKQFVAAQDMVAEARGLLNRLLAARQRKLRAEALKLGATVFAGSPTAVCGRLERHWNAWRRAVRRQRG